MECIRPAQRGWTEFELNREACGGDESLCSLSAGNCRSQLSGCPKGAVGSLLPPRHAGRWVRGEGIDNNARREIAQPPGWEVPVGVAVRIAVGVAGSTNGRVGTGVPRLGDEVGVWEPRAVAEPEATTDLAVAIADVGVAEPDGVALVVGVGEIAMVGVSMTSVGVVVLVG